MVVLQLGLSFACQRGRGRGWEARGGNLPAGFAEEAFPRLREWRYERGPPHLSMGDRELRRASCPAFATRRPSRTRLLSKEGVYRNLHSLRPIYLSRAGEVHVKARFELIRLWRCASRDQIPGSPSLAFGDFTCGRGHDRVRSRTRINGPGLFSPLQSSDLRKWEDRQGLRNGLYELSQVWEMGP